MRKRKRQAVKKLIQCAAVIAAGVLAIILFMLAIWYRGKNSEPVTDEQVAAQMQQAEPLVIETPEAATEGSIRVYDYDGCCIYSYYGKIRINSDGKDGKEIDVEALGYLEGYQEHKRGKRGGRMSHRYYSPLRPLSLGTFPKPQGNEILHIENFEERQNVPEIARQAWGYIEYKEALTEIEAAAYELIPSNCISEMENLEARR